MEKKQEREDIFTGKNQQNSNRYYILFTRVYKVIWDEYV